MKMQVRILLACAAAILAVSWFALRNKNTTLDAQLGQAPSAATPEATETP